MESAVTHILPLTLIRRKRVLPVPGRVLVSNGEKVIATDIVAQAGQPGRHVLVDVRRLLGFSRSDQAEKVIQCSQGIRVSQGDVIAQTEGLFSHTVRAPISGMVITISAGRVLIEEDSPPLQVRAGLSGIVREVIAERGVVIENHGALIQGRLGNNLADQGMLLIIARSADDELVSARLDVSMRGAVLVGGHCGQAEALKAAGELALRGLILSSITADLLPLLQQASYPIMVLEGIGKLPFCQAAFQLLTTNEKRDVCINAAAYDPYSGTRPELVVPLPGIGELPPEAVDFAPGKTVRMLAAPFASQSGSLIQVRAGKTRLASGIHAPAADIRLANNETITVALANLDVLE